MKGWKSRLVLEHLPGIHEDPGSIGSTIKKKKSTKKIPGGFLSFHTSIFGLLMSEVLNVTQSH